MKGTVFPGSFSIEFKKQKRPGTRFGYVKKYWISSTAHNYFVELSLKQKAKPAAHLRLGQLAIH